MVTATSSRRSYVWPLLLLIAADISIIASAGALPRYAASLALLLFLTGWVWVDAGFNRLLPLSERLTLAVGLSLALTVFGAMLAVYLPGPISVPKLLLITNGVTLVGLAALWYQRRSQTQPPQQSNSPASAAPTGYRTFLALALLLLLTVALRLPRLGYAEFHEDEAEALMLGVRLFEGEDYALFLHRKGPAQMLVPVSFWLLTNRITETLARFPFALSSILSVITLFFAGRRWFGRGAGLMAAGLWAINGYAIGFGRMVQYQALIFFLAPLALYCLYLAWDSGRMRFYIVGVILLAAGLLGHFDALLLLPAAAYLTWLVLSRREATSPPRSPSAAPLAKKLVTIFLALALLAGLLAAFYVPYALDPEFGNTTTYLIDTRVRPGLVYNNLVRLRGLDRDYSSHFYLPLLAAGLAAFVLLRGNPVTGHKPRAPSRNAADNRDAPLPSLDAPRTRFRLRPVVLHASLLILSFTTFWFPDLWQVGPINLAILPWLLTFGLCFWNANAPSRAAWLMAGGGFIGYGFLVDDPRTHLYILYPGAVLLAGAGLDRLRIWLSELRLFSKTAVRSSRFAFGAFAGVSAVWVALIVTYDTAVFLQTESTFARLRAQWDGSAWGAVYNDLPNPREYFGYPKREGWKAIGALRAQGHFPGDFRSVNENFIVPIWYNYGQARSCFDTPAHFLVRLQGLEPVQVGGYPLTGQIEREGEVRLQIFSASNAPAPAVTTYQLEPLANEFDQLATPGRFAQQNRPSRPVGAQFGPAILFAGFDLPTPVVAPGDTLQVNLYWLALDSPGQNYRAFVHLTDGATLWSQHDDSPACRLPTTIWRAGQHGLGQFRLQIPPEMPPGRYPLIIGLYQAGTLERLKITGGAGVVGDDFLWLTDVEVVDAG